MGFVVHRHDSMSWRRLKSLQGFPGLQSLLPPSGFGPSPDRSASRRRYRYSLPFIFAFGLACGSSCVLPETAVRTLIIHLHTRKKASVGWHLGSIHIRLVA
ncbi:hypothetical protein J3F84DRAFT_386124 [Trichoderma pleuroticola]